MKLTGATVLEGVVDALREQVSPQLNDGFASEAARMAQSLIAIVGRADDDAAAIRVEENARMRAIIFHPDLGLTHSAGCFMLPSADAKRFIDHIAGGTFVYVHGPRY